MNGDSARRAAYICLALLLVVAAAIFLLNRHQASLISDDVLSEGIAERWNAALPAGFAKETAGEIVEGVGMQFARLEYEEDIGGLLKQWTPPDAAMQARFDALIDAFLEDTATPDEAAWLRGARPTLDETWVCFALQSEEDAADEILLAYHRASRVMFLAERQA